ncbi:MAG: diaminopimelate decarboxylase family protein [Promethearchaeota archaeon]
MKILSGNPYLKINKKKIMVDLIPFDEILKLSKTPILIFLENKIRDNIISFKNIFGEIFENFEAFYSFKANFLPEICKIICSERIGAEIIGLPELQLALRLGFPVDKILIGGPYLPNELIEESVKNRVREIIVYSLNDLDKIDSIAKKRDNVQNICLRINSQKYESKLGINLDDKTILHLSKKIEKLQNINIVSILSHYATQMNNMELFIKNTSVLGSAFKKLTDIGIKIKNINLGGGFPEATIMPEKQLIKVANGLKTTIENFNIDYEKIYFEPGRYFIGDSGLFITETISVVKDRWIFLNIGNHICPKFARCSLRFYNASQIDEPHKFKTSIAGILPTDQDVLVKDYFFTEHLHVGDKVIVTNVGAYILTFSNRFPYSLPTIFLVKNSDIKKIFNASIDHDISLYYMKS